MNILNPVRAVWGAITGILSDQTDLQDALDLLAPLTDPKFLGKVFVRATPEGVNNITLTGTGAGTFKGDIGAANFSGSSSGTNTGDQNLAPYALIAGEAFTGDISAPNLSGTNTGDQNLAPYALIAGEAFTGDISAPNLSGTNTGDQNLAPYALLAGAVFTGGVDATSYSVNTGAGESDIFFNPGGTVDYSCYLSYTVSTGNFEVNFRNSSGGYAFTALVLNNSNKTATFTAPLAAANLSGTNTGDRPIATQLGNPVAVATDQSIASEATYDILTKFGAGIYLISLTEKVGSGLIFTAVNVPSGAVVYAYGGGVVCGAGTSVKNVSDDTMNFTLYRYE